MTSDKGPLKSFAAADERGAIINLSSWDFLFFPIIIIGLPGNILAFLYAATNITKIHGMAIFILNLSLSDFFINLVGIYYKYNENMGLYSQLICQIIAFFDVTLMHTSCYTILYIAYKRYRILKSSSHTLYENRIEKVDILFCVGSWTVPAILSLPMVYSVELHGAHCGTATPEHQHVAYRCFLFITTCVLPGVAVTYLHCKIITITRTISRDPVANLHITRFLLAITINFWIFHLPFWANYISMTVGLYLPPLWLARLGVYLTLVNASLDPFFYAFLADSNSSSVFVCLGKCLFCIHYFDAIHLMCAASNHSDMHLETIANPGEPGLDTGKPTSQRVEAITEDNDENASTAVDFHIEVHHTEV